MRPGFVTARRIRPEHAPQLFFVQDEEVVEAHAPNAADKPLADGVRVGCSNGCAQHLDAAPRRDTGERRPIPGVVVADRDARRPTERRGLAHLLGDPGVGRVSRHADLDDPPRAEIDDKEGEERAEAQVDDRQEVTRPDVMSVVMQERRPRLVLWARRAHAADALRPPICRFSSTIRLINATVAADTCGLFRAVADRTCQTRRYPWRCQRNSMSGWTMSSAARQPCARRARSASATRSRGVNAGCLTWRCSTCVCQGKSRPFDTLKVGHVLMRAARTHSAACRAKSDRHLFTVSRGSPRLVASPRCHDTRRRSRSARLRARVCARLRSSRQRSQEAGVCSRSKRTTVKRSPHSLHRALRSFIGSVGFC